MGRVMLSHLDPADLESRLDRSDIRRYTANTVADRGGLTQELADVRARGWAVVREEYEEGLSGVAVPIRRGNQVVAAANVSLHQHRGGTSTLSDLVLPRLVEAAEAISTDYGIRPLS